jgi:hypothetical protein
MLAEPAIAPSGPLRRRPDLAGRPSRTTRFVLTRGLVVGEGVSRCDDRRQKDQICRPVLGSRISHEEHRCRLRFAGACVNGLSSDTHQDVPSRASPVVAVASSALAIASPAVDCCAAPWRLEIIDRRTQVAAPSTVRPAARHWNRLVHGLVHRLVDKE